MPRGKPHRSPAFVTIDRMGGAEWERYSGCQSTRSALLHTESREVVSLSRVGCGAAAVADRKARPPHSTIAWREGNANAETFGSRSQCRPSGDLQQSSSLGGGGEVCWSRGALPPIPP